MSWTKKVTTTEEYDATGNLIKRVVVTEESGYPYVYPYYVGDPPVDHWWTPHNPLPTWTVSATDIKTGTIASGIVNDAWNQAKKNDGNDEPDAGVRAKK